MSYDDWKTTPPDYGEPPECPGCGEYLTELDRGLYYCDACDEQHIFSDEEPSDPRDRLGEY